MIIRLLAGIAIFGLGYALGKEIGRTEEIREEQRRLDPDQSHKVRIIDHSREAFDDPDEPGLSSSDR
ncbi:MAG: hypothetical protein U9R74_17365 [Pseudomonadota bacterium]|nr:hypothetical protein [Pseudomonadota bacterium]